MRTPILLALLTATALSACATTTPFVAPQAPLPAAYPHASADVASARQAQGQWWTAFGDAKLNRLVAKALAQNNDLAAAAIAVRKAQLQAGLAAEQLKPQLSGGADARTSASENVSARAYSASVAASWEVDLWGRLAAQRDAARWEADATQQDLESVALSLAGTASDLYFQLGYLNQRIASAEESLAYARQTQAMVQSQYRSGAVSGVEIAEAEQSVRGQEASLAALRQTQVETRNALALLLGGTPWPTAHEPQALTAYAVPDVAPGLPAELLGRRPDLRAAELRLRSSLSTVDATKASFYPTLDLTGSLGAASTSLVDLVADPIGVLGAGLTLPFLNWNQVRLNIKVSEADYEIAVTNFRQTLLSAFTDVDNALSARDRLAQQGASLDQALAAAQRADQLYAVRYRAGAVPLRTWLDAQEARRAAENAAAQNRQQQLANQVTLYQSLGGDAGPRP